MCLCVCVRVCVPILGVSVLHSCQLDLREFVFSWRERVCLCVCVRVCVPILGVSVLHSCQLD